MDQALLKAHRAGSGVERAIGGGTDEDHCSIDIEGAAEGGRGGWVGSRVEGNDDDLSTCGNAVGCGEVEVQAAAESPAVQV